VIKEISIALGVLVAAYTIGPVLVLMAVRLLVDLAHLFTF
jgi:hypothetical protein